MIYKAKKGQTSYGEAIGIILMESFMPFPPGCPGNATTFSFPVRYANVKYLAEWHGSWKGYNAEEWVISISNLDNLTTSEAAKLFLSIFTQIAGFNCKANEKKYGKWQNFSIDKNIKNMLKALYKVPPGYNLLTGEVE